MSSDPAANGPRRCVRIGKYEVLSHVATGGMGAVYKARDIEDDREVALKVLSPEMAAKPAMLERFRREAKHAAKLRHENVVTLYEFGEANDIYYLAMEFIDGIDLHEYSNRKGPLDPDEALQIIAQGCRALDHAFEQGIIHRDIKPSNFLVSRDGDQLMVKMTDLGLARESNSGEFRVTRAGTTVGTLDYMAPEQARDSGLADIRSDLYSLGSTWYHLLAGHAPFPKGGLGERLNRIMNEEPPDVRTLNPRVSEDTAAVLRRLMAKRPADRYQTPAELLGDLEALASGEPISSAVDAGETASPSRTFKKAPRSSAGRRGARSPRSRSGSHRKAGRAAGARSSRLYLWYGLAGVAALALVAGLIVVLSLRHSHKNDDPVVENTPNPPPIVPAVVQPAPPPPPDPNPDKPPKPVIPTPPTPKKRNWPALYQAKVPVNLDALRKEVEAPWAAAAATTQTVELVVGRVPPVSGKTFRSLAAACAAIPAGATGIIELHDNGPFFDVPAAVADRHLTIRAAAGFRPLLVWDVQRTLDERRRKSVRGQPADDARPLVFLDVKHGNLTLQDVQIALKWPEAPSQGAALLRVEDGDLTVAGCTFSIAGKPRDGLTLARFTATGPETARCRFTRCYARGAGLSILDLNAPGAQVLFENCLLVGGDRTLVQVTAAADRPTSLRAVRSTMICGKALLSVRPLKPTDRDPAFHWLGWDVLLSRKTKEAGGELLQLQDKVGTGHMAWRAINCLYTGWGTLLAGSSPIMATDLSGWRKLWDRAEGDEVHAEPWPTAVFPEPAEVPADTYRTADSPLVAFAASVAADQLLGCDLSTLPAVRDNWLSLTFDRFAILAPAVPDDPGPPDIPEPGDMLYHGEKLDLNQIDLGAYLQSVQKTRRLGPRVVLHLTGTGERFTTPIYLKGSSLVLYFEPPDENAEPLVLAPAGQGGQEALIDVEQGSLEMIGGTLRIADSPGARVVPWLIKVRGGDVRLFRSRLEVTPKSSGAAFRGLIALDGSGEPTAERVRSCAVNETVLVSARAGIHVQGIGTRVLLSQTLLVAGDDAVHVALDPGFTAKANVQCLLDHATVAARASVIHLPDVKQAGPPTEPMVVQTHDCAFLNPFSGRNNRAGLVLCDGDALSHGLLVWQSDRDAFGRRLHFASASASAVPNKPEDHLSWAALWGTSALRHAVLDPPSGRGFTDPEHWQLERLIGPKVLGANLEKLGITKKPKKTTP